MNKNQQNLLECLIEEIMHEVLRKFNLNQFKKIEDLNQMIMSAKKTLPLLGQGSARIAFAYSGGKVLKIALNQKGLSQNAAEKKVFDNVATRASVATIFDAKTNNTGIVWLISEIARVVKSEQEFEQLAGFEYTLFSEVIKKFAKETKGKGNIQTITTSLSDDFKKRAARHKSQGETSDVQHYEKQLKQIAVMEQSPFFKGIIAAVSVNRLMTGDILDLSHYGKTIDGRIVLLDYGFTEDVYQQHYKNTDMDSNAPTVNNVSQQSPGQVTTVPEIPRNVQKVTIPRQTAPAAQQEFPTTAPRRKIRPA